MSLEYSSKTVVNKKGNGKTNTIDVKVVADLHRDIDSYHTKHHLIKSLAEVFLTRKLFDFHGLIKFPSILTAFLRKYKITQY